MASRTGHIRCASERFEWGDRESAVAPLRPADSERRATLVRASSGPEVLLRALDIRARGGVPAIGDDRWSTQLASSLVVELENAELAGDTAWATFTSGSTARPRVVLRSESSWSTSYRAVSELLGLTPDDVVYAPAPLVSSLSLFAAVHALSEGADIRLPTGHSLAASDLADSTVVHSTPFALGLALDAIEAGAPHALRVAFIGGDRVSQSLRGRANAAGIDVIAYYGAAELSFVAVDVGDGLRPFPGVEVELRDGTVWVRSPYLASGYLASDSGPFEVDAAGWATVGDRASLDSTGALVLSGRADGAILTAAATVIPEDVEHTLRGAPGVRDVAVLGVEHPRMGALVTAVVEATKCSNRRASSARLCRGESLAPATTSSVVLHGRTSAHDVWQAGSRGTRRRCRSRSADETVTAPDSAIIVAARRSPITSRGRALSELTVDELAGPVLAAVETDLRIVTGSSFDIDEVFLGNCVGPGGNPARVAALAAGFGSHVPGVSIDRQCGSGLSAIALGADAVRAGSSRLVIAGGVESVSTAPTRVAHGTSYDRARFAPEGFPDPDMVDAAAAIASQFLISRDRQDAFAVRSHDLALAAIAAGRFDREIVPFDGVTDDGPTPNFARVASRFAPLVAGDAGHAVTAGNSSRFNDGAAAVAIVAERDRGGAPGLRVLAHVTTGVDPALPGLGPISAVRSVLARAGHPLENIVAIELVEAFAAQALASLDALGLIDSNGQVDARVNAHGGSLAFGHPWGASAAVSVVRLFSRLVHGGADAGSLGIATAAVGGGMGVAMLVEVVR